VKLVSYPIVSYLTIKYAVKPVYKCHSREPEIVAFEQLPFLYRLKLHVLFITRENETVICYRGSLLWQV